MPTWREPTVPMASKTGRFWGVGYIEIQCIKVNLYNKANRRWSQMAKALSAFFGVASAQVIPWNFRGSAAVSSEAFLAEISFRSTGKLFTFIIKKLFMGWKYPKKHLIYFGKNLHWPLVQRPPGPKELLLKLIVRSACFEFQTVPAKFGEYCIADAPVWWPGNVCTIIAYI